MSVSWGNERELMLIEWYQAEPAIWDVKHKDYKNKMKNHDAWKRISEIMDIPITDLKKKKDSLMSSYRTYRKKVRDSTHSGAGSEEIYKPIWFAYDIMDSFLGDGLSCNKTINTEEQSTNNNNEGEEEMEQQRKVPNERALPQVTRKRKNPPELTEAGNIVKDAIATLQTTINKKVSQSDQEDECDLYGTILAKKLRKLSEEERLQLMYEIDGMVLRRCLSRNPVRCSSTLVTYVSTPEPSPQSNYSYNYGQFNTKTSSQSYLGSAVQQERPCTSRSNHSESLQYSEVFPVHDVNAGSQVSIVSNEVIVPATSKIPHNIISSSLNDALNSVDDPQTYNDY